MRARHHPHLLRAETEHLAAAVLAARLQTILWNQKPAKPSTGCWIVAKGAVRVRRDHKLTA